MTTIPGPPWVSPQNVVFININSAGQIVINAATSPLTGLPFTGRLDNIFIGNQSNGIITVTISVIKLSVEYDFINYTLQPNEKTSVFTGQLRYIMPNDIYFVQTDADTNFVTCALDYVIFNELS